MTLRLFTCAYCFMLPVARGKTVEAKKPVPHMGTFWVGGASGATGYRVKIAGSGARVGINQRVSLRKFIEDIRRWVEEGRSDDWIASALGTSSSSVQTFRSRNAIYRRGATSTLYDPQDFSSYEGVLDPEGPGVWFDPEIGSDPHWHKRWSGTERVELRLTPTRIVFLRRGGAGGQANR
jgi:DNA-binding CsgD family transcriptional regulator